MQTFWFIFTGLACFVGLASCTPETKSPIVQKLETSELHELGASCGGTYFAFDGENLVMVTNGKSEVIQKSVRFTDTGDNRITMTANYGALNMVTRYRINSDATVLNFESFNFDPKLTSEQLAKLGLRPERELEAQMRETSPPMVLCPRNTT